MNALRVSLSLRAKENQCRNISHTHSPSHTDFAPLIDERCSYFSLEKIKKAHPEMNALRVSLSLRAKKKSV